MSHSDPEKITPPDPTPDPDDDDALLWPTDPDYTPTAIEQQQLDPVDADDDYSPTEEGDDDSPTEKGDDDDG